MLINIFNKIKHLGKTAKMAFICNKIKHLGEIQLQELQKKIY